MPSTRASDTADRAWRRLARNRIALASLAFLALVSAAAVGAPWVAPRDPYLHDLAERMKPPAPGRPMGTDRYGRDLLSRVIYAPRVSLAVGLSVALASLVVGGAAGVVAGYRGGVTDALVMRTIDLVLSFPGMILALTMVAVMGAGLHSMVVALVVVYTPPLARITRAAVLSLRELDFVQAARALGGSDAAIMLRHVVPGCLAPVVVQATLTVVYAIRTEVTLSFIGLGVPPPTPTLGQMVQEGTLVLRQAPWVVLMPGLVIGLLLFAVNSVGDALRDAWDPRLRGAR